MNLFWNTASNKRVNLTVQAARALRLSRRAPLRTVARKARATRPAGYAQRCAVNKEQR
jgi:hypothetical protein